MIGDMLFADGHSAATAYEVMEACYRGGCNFFDCAEAYGPNNQAERAFGEALRACGRRDEAVIASKFGKHKALWETSDPTGEQAVYDGDAVARALDASLAALNLQVIVETAEKGPLGMSALRALAKHFDPDQVLNPGVLLGDRSS